jgi:hypothetical protein
MLAVDHFGLEKVQARAGQADGIVFHQRVVPERKRQGEKRLVVENVEVEHPFPGPFPFLQIEPERVGRSERVGNRKREIRHLPRFQPGQGAKRPLFILGRSQNETKKACR